MKTNLILSTDSYKFSHGGFQYPKGSSYIHNYLESRGGHFDSTVFFGLQYIIKKHLLNPITLDDVKIAKDFCQNHGVPFYEKGWNYIANELGGKLPIRIRAVPEGSVISNHNVLMTMESTDPNTFWIVGHLETLLMQIWYPITVASQSYQTRKIILDSLNRTSDDPMSEVEFKHHSFGFRGVSSCESAAIGGAAELLSSKGTDTIAGILCAQEFYNAKEFPGFSIPASEHSTITSFGKEFEKEAYENMIDQFGKPGTIFACVSDTYDLWKAIDIWGSLKEKIIQSGATVVIRPDSGSPVEVVSKCLQLLDERFGSTINSKGFKVLNHVRVIQGDGININSIKDILDRVNSEGYSSTNLAFGQGGGSLQLVNRDTYKMAIKASCIKINDEYKDIFKDPITDPGKRSKSGRLDLVRWPNGKIETVTRNEKYNEFSIMRTVFENGQLLIDDNFDFIRERVNG